MYAVPSPARRAVGSWLRFAAILAALIAALVAGAVAAPRDAAAGEPVRLLVEIPPDVEFLRSEEVVDVQIVPLDAAGERVRPGGRTIEFAASSGTLEVRKRPYRYRFKAPATTGEAVVVRLRAWFREAPAIEGAVEVRVVSPSKWRRIVVEGPGTVAAGTGADLAVRGVPAEGPPADLGAEQVSARVEGPGKVSFVRAGALRYEAPAGAKGSAKVVVSLREDPDVTATHPVLLQDESAGSAADGTAGPALPPATSSTTTPPTTADAPAAPKSEGDGVVWTGGAVRVEVWRTRDADEKQFDADPRSLPAAGGEFVAAKEWNKLRFGVLRDDVASVAAEERIGEKDDAAVTRLDPGTDERLRVVRDAGGRFAIHWEGRTPKGGRPLALTLLLTTTDGKVVSEAFVLRRRQK